MERVNESIATSVEPIVIDRDGQVLYEPSGGSSHSGSSKTFEGHGSKARIKTIRVAKMGLLPKIFFGGLFGILLFVGLAAAGVFLGIFLVGLLAKMTFSPKRSRR